ncbi:hypothetical protein B0H14DRAFT_3774743 [Mycena olivaceomarginata]|nr:hypothetical protein B0H14DRAFT_3774743 [Mycena olivaceomarginata]
MATEKTPRAATVSDRARNAAAIAAAEGHESTTTTKKKRGRPKKTEPEPEPKPEPEIDVASATEADGADEIDWKDEDGIELTWKLITAIEENQLIRDSLFPPVGAPKITGGKPKSDYQYQLATLLFAKHLKYEAAFAKAVTSKDKKPWYTKVKNRLDYLVKKARTGEGIEKEEDIHPGTAFTTKWDKIKKEFPWFFHVRSLIGERPNLMPTGLGNNESEVDLSLLLTSDRDGDDMSSFGPDDTEGPGSPTGSTAPVVDVDDDSDSDLPPPALLAAPSAIRKRKPSESGVDTVKPEKKKTKPSPGVSQPAPTKTPAAKPVTAKDKFAAMAVAEEQTAQQSLQVRQSKVIARKEVELAQKEFELEKLRMQGKAKVEKEWARREIIELKMKQEHEYRMEQMRMEQMRMQAMGAMGQRHAGPSTYTGGPQTRFNLPFFFDPAADTSLDFESTVSAGSFDGSFDVSSTSTHPYSTGSGSPK